MEDSEAVDLADAVRRRVVAIGSAVLGNLTALEVPAALRRIAKFAPTRRARMGADAIADTLEVDVVFRQRTAEHALAGNPTLAAELRAGKLAVDADAVEVAALAYLVRPDGWRDLVRHANEEVARREADQRDSDHALAVERLSEQLAALRTATRDELAATRAEFDGLRAERALLRQRLGQAREEARAAVRAAEAAQAQLVELRAGADSVPPSDPEVRRIRQRLAETESALEAARRAARESRATESVRTKLLLDTLIDAALGLRRELALPALVTRPADLVGRGDPEASAPSARGRNADDPVLLDQLLEVPRVHLVVDGYNVTKTGYAGLTLEDQRSRLLTSLGTLAARTRAEVTCVFDGAEVSTPGAAPATRGVRLRFSQPGVTADDLIRELVDAEPVGRPLVVVTNDLEIIRDVRKAGAWTAGALALLRLLSAR